MNLYSTDLQNFTKTGNLESTEQVFCLRKHYVMNFKFSKSHNLLIGVNDLNIAEITRINN